MSSALYTVDMNTTTAPIVSTRIDISNETTAPTASNWDADIAAAVTTGRISIARANRIQEARA